jgi:alkaline phosphatase
MIGEVGQDILPRNIILLIGDGMGFAHIAAARLWKHGPDGRLAMDELPERGTATTRSASDAVTDSAAAGTAIATGYKTQNGFVSVAPDGLTVLDTVLEQARARGKATGIVVTSTLTDATPAAFVAHGDDRHQQNAIAVQLLKPGVDALLGGGAQHFIPSGTSITTVAGARPNDCDSRRRDGRDLVAQAQTSGYAIAMSRRELDAASSTPLLGLFACGSMSFDLERQDNEPSLTEMTRKALSLLSADADGFFLMVEGSRIDSASHANDARNALGDTIAFDEAVRTALEFARADGETLVIVTADHETGGLSFQRMAGAPTSRRFLPIAGSPNERLRVRWATSEHTAQDVLVAGYGPLAHRLSGALDNTDIYRVMASALGIEVKPVALPAPAPVVRPTATPTLPLEQACAPAEPIASPVSNVHPNGDGALKIGLTGHANFWWQSATLEGHTNLDRARLVGQLMDREQVDFTVWLGDDFHLCDGGQLAAFVEATRAFRQPVYKVVGNHDLDDNHGELLHPLQRERYNALFGHDIYWHLDTQGYRLVFLAAESALGESYVSDAQLAFLKAALESSPHPVLVFAHHVLPVRRVEQLNAMIGAGSGNTREVTDAVRASGKVVFWGWIHLYNRGREPVQASGLVEHSPHFITGYVDEAFLDSLEASVLTIAGGALTIEVFDVFTSQSLKRFSFDLPR